MTRVSVKTACLGGAWGRLALLLGLAVGILPAQAIEAQSNPASEPASLAVIGQVVDESGHPVVNATVMVSGTQRGVLTDAEGRFRLVVRSEGDVRITASALGYAAREVDAAVGPSADLLTIVLAADPLALEPLTITGTRKAVVVSASPVKVNVVPSAVLQRNATNNLVETISFVNGLYQQVDCGVCYTNNLRINGMEGPYTAVLIDGMPIMSSLASVYGLNGINPALIEQVEIIKGPSSTLYGSEAMGGVINVITKDPRFTPRFAVDASATSDAEANVDFALSTEPGDLSAAFSGNVAYNSMFMDANRDGFSDIPLTKRAVLFSKLDWSPEGQQRGSFTAKYLFEDRFGGVEAWTRADRGSSQIYGESIYTNRVELLGSYLPGWSDEVRIEGSYAWHDQDSWYGDS